MKKLFLIALFIPCYTAWGQASLFNDAKGESALKFFGSSVALSTKDESINFAAGKLFRIRNSSDTIDKFNRWGGTLELKANEGLSNLKTDNKYLVDGSVGGYFGYKLSPNAKAVNGSWTLERYISASIGADKNKLFNTNLSAKDMVYNKGQFVYKIELGQFGYTCNFLYGISASFKRQTNVDDIKTKAVSFLDYVSGNDSITVLRQKQAYDINEFIGDQHALSINGDGALLLNRKKATGEGTVPPMFLAFHFRYQHLEDEHGQLNPAIGFYLGKHGAPRNIVGGFNIQFLDLLNAKNDKSNAWDRAAINFVVGFKLGS